MLQMLCAQENLTLIQKNRNNVKNITKETTINFTPAHIPYNANVQRKKLGWLSAFYSKL